jgi:hypothetical protein
MGLKTKNVLSKSSLKIGFKIMMSIIRVNIFGGPPGCRIVSD